MQYEEQESPKLSKFILSLLFQQVDKTCKNYDIAICGDFKNINQLLFLTNNLHKGGKLMYVDDGFTSIYPLNNIDYRDRHFSLRYHAYILYRTIKKVDDSYFFSIFRHGQTKYNIINNQLNILKRKSEKNLAGVYILGTVVQFINSILPTGTFEDYFNRALKYAKRTYPNQNIYYSPHGRSIETKGIEELCEKFNVKTIISKYSVEIDYSLNNYNPLCIIGFGSTALISLKKIFPKSDICNICIPSKIAIYTEKHNMINKYLSKELIKTINI